MPTEPSDFATKYQQVQAKLECLRSLSPEARAKLLEEWSELWRDVKASINEDPASPKVQALATRWQQVFEPFATGEGSFTPPDVSKLMLESAQALELINKALAFRGRGTA
jgi:TipAS antibiotic-recognition domain